MSSILEQINKPNDIKKISPRDYQALSEEIREFLINSVSRTGGHLASNLGVVELTMALHLCMDFPKDKLIWDVGHQAYTHKLLTGRKDAFDTLRTYGGMSGFPKRAESDCDAFDTGHSTTSISAALGYARARDLLHEDYTVVAVIGDGSLTGGMAYEALNNAVSLPSNMIIILNDNKMSISENVGGLSKHLNELRINRGYIEFKDDVEARLKKIPYLGESMVASMRKSKATLKQRLFDGGIFEALGIDYLGPIDGHNIDQLVKGIRMAKRSRKPIVVHVITQKGHGYMPAEKDPSFFHGVGSFDIETGKLNDNSNVSYTEVFARSLCRMAKTDEKIVAITAAMPDGTGLTKFKERYPNRFFDVGIAEEHATTFAAGLAAGGIKPYFAVYSSFLQRGFDQIIHDVCIQNLPVVFCIDRAGLVGADGETHQGIMDLSYLNIIPNMTIIAPKNKYELYDMVKFSTTFDAPLAIRYPRGAAWDGLKKHRTPIVYGKSELIVSGTEIALAAVGSMVETAEKVRTLLEARGLFVTVVNARFVKPMDTTMLESLPAQHRLVVTMEENILKGGFGESVNDFYCRQSQDKPALMNIGVDDIYVTHGAPALLKKELQLDAETIADKIFDLYEQIRKED